LKPAANIKLLPIEMSMVSKATKTFSEYLTGWHKKQFDTTTLKKVKESKDCLLMDGMELKYLTQALRREGWAYFYKGKRTKAVTYFELAQWIKGEREELQEIHNSIKKQLA
jgi:hypothetical protein